MVLSTLSVYFGSTLRVDKTWLPIFFAIRENKLHLCIICAFMEDEKEREALYRVHGKHPDLFRQFNKHLVADIRNCQYWDVVIFVQAFLSGFSIWHTRHVIRHGHFILKQLGLSVLNEMHTNSYIGPRLKWYLMVVTLNYKLFMFKPL